jgi:ATP-dependent exoDNAse (exonuclease V) alpha subunit
MKCDRVIHNKNDYNISVMNGDVGVIKEVSPENIKVYFKAYDQIITFNTQIVDDKEEHQEPHVGNLDIGFACTIDKFQGSEALYTILYAPTDDVNAMFIDMNRLYTSFTRARIAFFGVGNIQQILVGTRKTVKYRHEKLSARLRILMGLPELPTNDTEIDFEP